jgi:hypothetical protein
MPYSVEITLHNDPDANASFVIKPPIKFINPEGMALLGGVIKGIIADRMDSDEAGDFELAITHNLPDNEGTIGFARFVGLKRATGVVVLQQGLERGLNGDNNFVSPSSPLIAD